MHYKPASLQAVDSPSRVTRIRRWLFPTRFSFVQLLNAGIVPEPE